MARIPNTYVVDTAAAISERLNGLSIRAFESTDLAAARWCLQLWDEGAIEVLCIGTSQEAAAYLEGFTKALDVTNR